MTIIIIVIVVVPPDQLTCNIKITTISYDVRGIDRRVSPASGFEVAAYVYVVVYIQISSATPQMDNEFSTVAIIPSFSPGIFN